MNSSRGFRHAFTLAGILAATGAAGLQAAEPARRADIQCLAIEANAGWQSTGLSVSPGQFVCIAADGLWTHGAQGLQAITPYYGPEGFGKDEPDTVPEVVSRTGALIGKIGGNAPFLVEKQLCFIPSAPGELRLSMNDEPGAFANNRGSLSVRIARWADYRWAPAQPAPEPRACQPR